MKIEEKQQAIIQKALSIPLKDWEYKNNHYYEAYLNGYKWVISTVSQGCPKQLWVNDVIIPDSKHKIGILFQWLRDFTALAKSKKESELIDQIYTKIKTRA